jgi:hypothetical protein
MNISFLTTGVQQYSLFSLADLKDSMTALNGTSLVQNSSSLFPFYVFHHFIFLQHTSVCFPYGTSLFASNPL